MADKMAAEVHISFAGDMSAEGRKDIADWLRDQADRLERDGTQYDPCYVARYLYEPRS
jgi:hypothetical protein